MVNLLGLEVHHGIVSYTTPSPLQANLLVGGILPEIENAEITPNKISEKATEAAGGVGGAVGSAAQGAAKIAGAVLGAGIAGPIRWVEQLGSISFGEARDLSPAFPLNLQPCRQEDEDKEGHEKCGRDAGRIQGGPRQDGGCACKQHFARL